MSANTPDRPDVPVRCGVRWPLLRGADQRCIAVLAAGALLAIGLNVRSSDSALTLVDLRDPVDVRRLPAADRGFQLDLNRADWPEWMLLPRIGETLARRIVASREEEGPFESPDDLLRVSGIGPKTLANLRPLLLPPRPSGTPAAR